MQKNETPQSPLLTKEEVCAYIKYKKSSVHNFLKRGGDRYDPTFPRPVNEDRDEEEKNKTRTKRLWSRAEIELWVFRKLNGQNGSLEMQNVTKEPVAKDKEGDQ